METTLLIDDLVKMLKMSKSYIYHLIATGKLARPCKIGKKSFWLQADVQSFLNQCIAERDLKK